jgi:hypothetical protein
MGDERLVYAAARNADPAGSHRGGRLYLEPRAVNLTWSGHHDHLSLRYAAS